jgi:hypothetical protein
VTVAATFGFAVSACGPDSWLGGTSYWHWTQCEPGVKPDPYHYLPDGGWDPCFGHELPADDAYDSPDAAPPDAASSDAASSSAKDSCPDPERMCKSRPIQWDGPWLLWSGPPDQAPECPDVGPTGVGWEGYDDLAPTECEPCRCAASTGTCSLSPGLTAHDVLCEDLGKPHQDISFDAKASWKGECDSENPIDGKSGIVSLSVSAIEIHTNGCSVVSTVPRDRGALPSRWNTFARACAGSGWTSCDAFNGTCVQKVPESFRLCIGHEGTMDCPSLGNWHDRHVFYGGVNDQRTCTECTCGAPAGEMCVGSLSVYDDGSCTNDAMGKFPMSSFKDSCFDILPPGMQLGSKSAAKPSYVAGACAPSPGKPSGGAVEKIAAMTFCCEP